MKNIFYILIFSAAIGGAVFGYKKITAPHVEYVEYKVAKGDIVQKVIVNGKNKAITSINLGFEVGGRITSTGVSIGSHVSTGQTLITLDDKQIKGEIIKARAYIASEQATLDHLRKGAKPEEVSVRETEVANAEVALSDAKKSLKDKVEDVVNNNIDQLFSNPHSINPQFNIQTSSYNLKDKIISGRIQIETIINNWTSQDININLPIISTFIENVAMAVNDQTSSTNITQATLDGYKSALSSARNTIIVAEQKINSAQSALTLAQKNLEVMKSGNAEEIINSQVSRVAQAQADLETIQSQLSKLVMKSSQDGVVTIQDAKVGQIVTPGKTLITIISDSNMQVDAYISEVNIGKVAIGNEVSMSFDAFPGNKYSGKVTYIEPGETVIDGVVSYKATIAFSQNYPELKSGMTSRVEMVTNSKSNVISIPTYSIIYRDNQSFVLKKNGAVFEEVKIIPGIRSQDGFIEVREGLKLGDVVEITPK